MRIDEGIFSQVQEINTRAVNFANNRRFTTLASGVLAFFNGFVRFVNKSKWAGLKWN